MSYKNSAKNRKLKRTLLKMIWFINFSWLNLSIQQKIVLIWIIIWIISLFMSWVDSVDNFISWNIFTPVIGLTWYIFLIIYLVCLFLIISKKNYIIIKNIINFSIKDWIILTILSIFSLLLSINTIYIINWLSTFKEWIFFWRWVVFCVIWSILMIVWWIMIIKNKDKVSVFWVNIEEENSLVSEEKTIVDEKNNMKLPF